MTSPPLSERERFMNSIDKYILTMSGQPQDMSEEELKRVSSRVDALANHIPSLEPDTYASGPSTVAPKPTNKSTKFSRVNWISFTAASVLFIAFAASVFLFGKNAEITRENQRLLKTLEEHERRIDTLEQSLADSQLQRDKFGIDASSVGNPSVDIRDFGSVKEEASNADAPIPDGSKNNDPP